MLRCAQKFPRLLYFMRADDTPLMWRVVTGDTLVSWNTERHAIAERATTPLRTPRATIERDMVTISVEEWAAWAEEDAWLNSITMPILE